MHLLNEALRRHDETHQIETPNVETGMYVQFKLPHTVNVDRMQKRLAKRHVLITPGNHFYLSDYLAREKFLRISVARAASDQIEDGVREIVEEVERETRR